MARADYALWHKHNMHIQKPTMILTHIKFYSHWIVATRVNFFLLRIALIMVRVLGWVYSFRFPRAISFYFVSALTYNYFPLLDRNLIPPSLYISNTPPPPPRHLTNDFNSILHTSSLLRSFVISGSYTYLKPLRLCICLCPWRKMRSAPPPLSGCMTPGMRQRRSVTTPALPTGRKFGRITQKGPIKMWISWTEIEFAKQRLKKGQTLLS
jgi:hypothetical protein